MSLPRDGIKHTGVEAIVDLASSARLENGLDAINPLFLQFIDLLLGFRAGTRKASELFFQIRASSRRKFFEVFRPMSARSREQRAARGQVRAQELAAIHRRTHLENAVQTVPNASHGGHSAV